AEQALAAWQAGVGELAAGETALSPVDNPSLLVELLPTEEELMRVGGENAEQFAEYHRSKRLAEVVLKAVGPGQAAQRADLDIATAAERFADWLRAHRADQPEPADADQPERADADQSEPASLEELVTELADSWCFDDPTAVNGTCSPHRVALTVLHLRNFYQD